ncbi:HutD/Ves family protein [Rubrivivax rivuli]|nr:HutD family protein [Rubrivivax rivuli]
MKALVTLAEVPAVPWKNGGGLTRELLLWPPGSTAQDWQLRISVAEIARSGPFSAYPGIARWFCVLQGAGVALGFPDGPRVLTPDSPPLHFDGALAPGCTLLAGTTLDLNLMARQDAGRAEMGRAVAGVPWVSRAPLRACFTIGGARLACGAASPQALPSGSLWWRDSDDTEAEAWQLTGAGDSGWWLAFEPLTHFSR